MQTLDNDPESRSRTPSPGAGHPALGRKRSYPGSNTKTSPLSPRPGVNWETTLNTLARQLNSICRTNETSRTIKCSTAPSSPRISPRPRSPNALFPGDKRVAVSHLQSEEKLREKLSAICQPTRNNRHSFESSPSASPRQSRRSARRRISLPRPDFRASINIGNCGIVDLKVFVQDHTLHVSPREDLENAENVGQLPATIQIPAEVSPEKLICLVKDGSLEIRESKRRSAPKGRMLKGLDLRRTNSHDPTRKRPVISEQAPIVIEADDSENLKLVMQMPSGFGLEDIHLKTVDDHLFVSAYHSNKIEACKHEMKECSDQCRRPSVQEEVFQVFELPESVDPYSIEAQLTEKGQLVILATLSSPKELTVWIFIFIKWK